MRRVRAASLVLAVAAASGAAGCTEAGICDPWLSYVWWDQPDVYRALERPPPGLEVEVGPFEGFAFRHPDVDARWSTYALRAVTWRDGEREGNLFAGAPGMGEGAAVAYTDPRNDREGARAFLATVLDADDAELEAMIDALVARQARNEDEFPGYRVGSTDVSAPISVERVYDRLLRAEGPPGGEIGNGRFASLGWEHWRFDFDVPWRIVRIDAEDPGMTVQARADGRVLLGHGPLRDGSEDYRIDLGMRPAAARAWASEAFPAHGLPAPTFANFTRIPMNTCSEAYPPPDVPIAPEAG